MLKFCQFIERAYLISGMVGRRNINRSSIQKQLFEKQRPLFTKNPHDWHRGDSQLKNNLKVFNPVSFHQENY